MTTITIQISAHLVLDRLAFSPVLATVPSHWLELNPKDHQMYTKIMRILKINYESSVMAENRSGQKCRELPEKPQNGPGCFLPKC